MLRKSLLHLKWWIATYILLGFTIQFLSSLGIVMFQQILDMALVVSGIGELSNYIIIYGTC